MIRLALLTVLLFNILPSSISSAAPKEDYLTQINSVCERATVFHQLDFLSIKLVKTDVCWRVLKAAEESWPRLKRSRCRVGLVSVNEEGHSGEYIDLSCPTTRRAYQLLLDTVWKENPEARSADSEIVKACVRAKTDLARAFVYSEVCDRAVKAAFDHNWKFLTENACFYSGWVKTAYSTPETIVISCYGRQWPKLKKGGEVK